MEEMAVMGGISMDEMVKEHAEAAKLQEGILELDTIPAVPRSPESSSAPYLCTDHSYKHT